MIEFRSARIPRGSGRRLMIERWALGRGEFWVVAGRGGAKSTLGRVIAGVGAAPWNGDFLEPAPVIPGVRRIPPDLRGSWISPDAEAAIRAKLRRDDDSEWSGCPDEGTSIEGFLGDSAVRDFLRPGLMKGLGGRGIRRLSTGEFRQVLIAREAGRGLPLAVLDGPFEGLDEDARLRVMGVLARWRLFWRTAVLMVNRLEDVPGWADGMVILEDDALVMQGPVKRVLASPAARRVFAEGPVLERGRVRNDKAAPSEVIIEFKGVNIAYNGRRVLDGVEWRIRAGESWLLTGANSSGKTTLLNLMCGNEPRAYGKPIWIFGLRRGSGESVAEIQGEMGHVSSMMQEGVPGYASVLEVLGSGLRDSMVVNPPLDGYECSRAREWAERLGLGDVSEGFHRLSYGERRLVMMGRAMIKEPRLLLLDEPMQGLEGASRRRAGALVDSVVREGRTSVVFVSHRPGDAPGSIVRHLRLEAAFPGGPSRALDVTGGRFSG